MKAAWRMARVFFVRDCAIDISYRVSMALEAADLMLGVAAFFYLSRVMGSVRPDGYDPFAFLLIGVAANNAMTTALTCFSQAVRLDQQGGTIKPLLMAPVAPATAVALASAYPLARSAASALVYGAAGALLFGVPGSGANLAAALVVGVLSLLAFAAIGMLSAVFALVLKKSDPVVWLFGALSWLLGGVFFPVSALPPALQQLSALLPITHATAALRATLLADSGLRGVAGEVAILGAIAAIGLPLALTLVEVAVQAEKRRGTLGHA